MQENKPILIVGLGNPGAQYSGTRHNVGFMAVDKMAGKMAIWKKEKNALVTKQSHPPSAGADTPRQGRWEFIYAKPQTFMNLSGAAVLALMTFYKVQLENLIVIHDDIDLKLGDVREKVGGGSAGHNGIKSIDAAVGREYRRIRIGVGRPPADSYIDSSDWVLGKFTNDEMTEINRVIDSLPVTSDQ